MFTDFERPLTTLGRIAVLVGVMALARPAWADHADKSCFFSSSQCDASRAQDQAYELNELALRLKIARAHLVEGGTKSEFELLQAMRGFAEVLREFNESLDKYLDNKSWRWALKKIEPSQARSAAAFHPYAFALLAGILKAEGGLTIPQFASRHQTEFATKTLEDFQKQLGRYQGLLQRVSKEAKDIAEMFEIKKTSSKSYSDPLGQVLSFHYVDQMEVKDAQVYKYLKTHAAILGLAEKVVLAPDLEDSLGRAAQRASETAEALLQTR